MSHRAVKTRLYAAPPHRLAAILLALALLGAAQGAAGAEALPAGKAIRLLVGSPAGGGTDHAARLVAHFLGHALPGSPTIIVQNMPGAGGVLALNHLFARAERDGSVLLVGSSSTLTPDLLRHNPAVAYDPARLAFIGGFAAGSTVLVVNRAAFARMEQGGAPLVVAQVGAARTGAQMALWGAAALGWRIRWISGYAGSADLANALLRGEADMTDTAGLSNLLPLLADRRFMALAQTGVVVKGRFTPRDAFADIPLFSALLAGRLDKRAESAFTHWLGTTTIGKFLALPPSVPAATVARYRAAFRAMTADPHFQDLAASEIGGDYAVMSHEDLGAILAELAAMPESELAILSGLKERYGVPLGAH